MLYDKINQDYIQAMKAKDKTRSSTLNFLRAQLKDILINERKTSLDDPEVIAVIKKQVKQREESIRQFEQGGRQDLVDQETVGAAILREYLPEEMSEDEIRKLVLEAITSTGAASMKDMGSVMKHVIEQSKGRADNKIVSEVVKAEIGKL